MTTRVTPNEISIPYKFSVYRSAALAAVATTVTKIAFDTKEFDTSSNFDATTNFQFTAPVSGFYHFDSNIGTTSITPTRFFVMFYKNGSEFKRGNDIASSVQNVSISDTMQLSSGDTVDVRYFSSTGGGGIAGQNLTYFSGYLISVT